LSQLPISFIFNSERSSVILIGSKNVRLSIDDWEGLQVHPLCASTFELACHFATVEVGPEFYAYFCVRQHHLELRKISKKAGYHQSFSYLEDTPVSLLFDEFTEKMILCSFSKKLNSSFLRLIDPDTKICSAMLRLSRNEKIECACIWRVKTKRYICIGTTTIQKTGRVIVYSIKKDSSGALPLVFQFMREIEMPAKVTAIATFDSYLAVSSADTLFQIKINQQNRQ
jgi:hypothetical protein